MEINKPCEIVQFPTGGSTTFISRRNGASKAGASPNYSFWIIVGLIILLLLMDDKK